jgi:hypothetical protein
VAVLLAEVRDVAASGLEDTKPKQTQHRDECEVAAVGRLLRCGQQPLELKVRQTQGRGFGWDVRAAHVLGRGVLEDAIHLGHRLFGQATTRARRTDATRAATSFEPPAASAASHPRPRAGAVKVERPTGRTTLTATNADAHSNASRPRP